MIVGLTGGIGSGKTTVAKMFGSLAVPIISADEISRDLMRNNVFVFDQILAHFGTYYLNADKQIDRKKIAQQIFSSKPDKLWLESLLHPLIKQEIILRAAKLSTPYCIVEIPLLLEANMQDCVDRILTISCSLQLQKQRVMLRDERSKKLIDVIIASQLSDAQRLKLSDDVIDNSTTIEKLQSLVLEQHQKYLQIATPKN